MATKPTIANITWAADANFASGPANGTPTKVAPSAIAAQGWRPGDALGFVGAWFNYLLNQYFLWCTYLGDLHNSTDFLNKAYNWTANHTFSADVGIYTTATINGVATVNNTNGLMLGVGVEAQYTAARTRVVTIPWLEGAGQDTFTNGTAPDGPTSGASVGHMRVVANGTLAGSGAAYKAITIPQGAILTGWRVLSTPTQGNFTFQYELYQNTLNFGTPGESAVQQGATQSQAGVAGTYYTKGQSGLSVTASANTLMYIGCSIMSSPAPPAEYELDIVGIELTYTEIRATGSL